MEFISKFKQYLNENFGNSPEERWEYIQPKLVNLPDTPDTQALIKGMEDAMMEDNKFEFDYYFVEAMKMLGLENELRDYEDDNPSSKSNFTDRELANIFVRENDNVLDETIKEGEKTDYMKRRKKTSDYYINPEAEEIDDEDLEAASDYFDSLAENDNVLDEIIKEGTWALGNPKQIEDVIRSLQGVFRMADNAESKRGSAGRIAVDVFQRQIKDEQWTALLYRILGDDKFWDAYGSAQTAAEAKDFDRAKNYLGDAIDRAKELKAAALKNNEVKGEVQTESIKKVLDASNDLETALNNASDELTDDQIDSITNMILDLRDKVKAKVKAKPKK